MGHILILAGDYLSYTSSKIPETVRSIPEIISIVKDIFTILAIIAGAYNKHICLSLFCPSCKTFNISFLYK